MKPSGRKFFYFYLTYFVLVVSSETYGDGLAFIHNILYYHA